MTLAPTLTTDRLTLRAPREGDFDAYAAFYGSERSRPVGGPQPRFESWIAFLALPGHWALRGYGYWMVEDRAGALVGSVGIIKHDGWPAPELGWQIFEGFEGEGYATEAAISARDWAARQGMGELLSFVAPDNTRSLATAARLGAQKIGEADSPFGPVTVWLHPMGAK